MKTWIPIIFLLIAVTGLCVWDSIHTTRVFDRLSSESDAIYNSILTTEITDESLDEKINNLNDYWTKEMDTLCISISRKDLQVVSDYLQYLCAAIINESQEDAVKYSRLLNYNIIGLKQTTGISALNLL